MATFRCGKCGCDEDTALCNYWSDRVRDILPVCSACDPKIGKWHGQFPRLFGAFLVTPSPIKGPRAVLASLVGQLRLAEGSSRQARTGAVPLDGTFDFNDTVPWYKPLASPRPNVPSLAERAAPAASTAQRRSFAR
jgi:hypothetical protein